MSYLFGFSGRINRAKIWLFVLIAIVWSIVVMAIAAFGLDWHDCIATFKAAAQQAGPGHPLDWSAVAPPHMAGTKGIIAVGAIVVLYLLYVIAKLAIYTKRLHDRNKSAWWLVPFVVLPGILGIYVLSRIAGSPDVMMVSSSLAVGAARLGAFVFGMWAFIELFFFRGTKGENRYGPDPLGP